MVVDARHCFTASFASPAISVGVIAGAMIADADVAQVAELPEHGSGVSSPHSSARTSHGVRLPGRDVSKRRMSFVAVRRIAR
jgi:hypothetical protein